jgi:hypothetical protein
MPGSVRGAAGNSRPYRDHQPATQPPLPHIKALVDMCELAQRLAQKPLEQIGPAYHIENQQGVKFVVADKPAVSPGTPHLNGAHVTLTPPAAGKRHKVKPDGLPTMTAMVATAVSGSSKGAAPGEIIAFIRAKWWPDVAAVRVYAIVSSMLKHGKLQRKRGCNFTTLPHLALPCATKENAVEAAA